MKYIVLIAVIVIVLWLLRAGRTSRRGEAGAPPRPTPPPAVQQEMVECPVCRVHLPRSDALPGPDGQLYCCAEHRQLAGR